MKHPLWFPSSMRRSCKHVRNTTFSSLKVVVFFNLPADLLAPWGVPYELKKHNRFNTRNSVSFTRQCQKFLFAYHRLSTVTHASNKVALPVSQSERMRTMRDTRPVTESLYLIVVVLVKVNTCCWITESLSSSMKQLVRNFIVCFHWKKFRGGVTHIRK